MGTYGYEHEMDRTPGSGSGSGSGSSGPKPSRAPTPEETVPGGLPFLLLRTWNRNPEGEVLQGLWGLEGQHKGGGTFHEFQKKIAPLPHPSQTNEVIRKPSWGWG